MSNRELNDVVDMQLLDAGVELEPRPEPTRDLMKVDVKVLEQVLKVMQHLRSLTGRYSSALRGESGIQANVGITVLSVEATLVALALDIRRLSDELTGLGFEMDDADMVIDAHEKLRPKAEPSAESLSTQHFWDSINHMIGQRNTQRQRGRSDMYQELTPMWAGQQVDQTQLADMQKLRESMMQQAWSVTPAVLAHQKLVYTGDSVSGFVGEAITEQLAPAQNEKFQSLASRIKQLLGNT